MPKAAKDATNVPVVSKNLPAPLRVLIDHLSEEQFPFTPLDGWSFAAGAQNGLGLVSVEYIRGSEQEIQADLLDTEGSLCQQLRRICTIGRVCAKILVDAGFPEEGGELRYDGERQIVLTRPSGKSHLVITDLQDQTGAELLRQAYKDAQFHARPSGN